MPVIVPAGQFNPSSLSADDLYLSILNPPGFIRGVPTDVIGVVGTASWGPVNAAVHMGSPYDALTNYGAISAISLSDPYDLASDLALAFGQASSTASLEGWAVRVSDGTDTAASATLAGTVSAASIQAAIGGTITAGDTLSLIFTSTALPGSPVTLTYTVKTGDSLNSIAASFASLIMANGFLVNAGVFASAATANVDIWQPAALSPQIVVTSSHSTGATETVTITTAGPTSTSGIKIAGKFTGVLGNQITCTIQAGSATGTFTVLLALPAIGAQESYSNISGTNFWLNLRTAINNGQSGVRGPSNICVASNANSAVGAPTPGTTTLSGGTDGRGGVSTATLVGSDTAVPKTGLYALRQQNPAVGVIWLVGCTDPLAVQPLLGFEQTEGCLALVPFPGGTSTATAIAQVQTNGVHDPGIWYLKDWIYWFDAVNNTVRYSPPTAVIGGRVATLPPQENPGNTQINMVIGTDRINPPNGYSIPYTDTEVGQLANAGIGLITNPVPQGNVWGVRTAQTTALNAAETGVEWVRMTSFLARSIASNMGAFVDANQSQQPVDPVRSQVKAQLNKFLTSLGGQIDGFSVVCTFSASPTATPGNGVNTPTSIQQGYLYALVRVTYLATVRFFIVALQGGTTVVTVGSTPGQQLAA